MAVKKKDKTTINSIKTTDGQDTKRKKELKKSVILSKKMDLKNNDKTLEKVENYVNKNREKTSQEMAERKSKRPVKKYQEGDLEVMISRIGAESKPKEKTKETSKWILYIIYTIIIGLIIIFMVKYFFVGKIPQIS